MQEQNEVSAYFAINKIDTIYFTNIHVSKSGMRRRFNIFVVVDNQPVMLQTLFPSSGYPDNIRKFCGQNGFTFSTEKGEFAITGCGMDMLEHTSQKIAELANISYLKHKVI